MGWVKSTLVTTFSPSKAIDGIFSYWYEKSLQDFVWKIHRNWVWMIHRWWIFPGQIQLDNFYPFGFDSGCSEYKRQQIIFVFIRFVITVVIEDRSNKGGHVNYVTKFILFLVVVCERKLTIRHKVSGSNPSVRSQSV